MSRSRARSWSSASRAAPPERLPRALLEEPCAKALFGILVEGLGDRFEPALCDAYARLFSQAIEGQDAASLVARYDRVRRTRPVEWEPKRVLVLSRVTLGADVAVTSVLLAAAKQAWANAEIVFVGPRKNFELFAADGRLSHAAVEYRRGSLHERLAVWDELKSLAAAPDCLVIDPDSRLTQLGLLPVCDEDRYHLFESRRYGGASEDNLPALAAQWAHETLGVPNAAPYVAVGRASGLSTAPYIAVSLGVGENPAKRIADPFEAGAASPAGSARPAGDRQRRRRRRSGTRGARRRRRRHATFWDGCFAGFAKIIAGSSLYVGYDSAGQHVAAACGVPLISIFAGFPAPRMFHRWRPTGPRVTVIRVDRPEPAEILARVAHALAEIHD